MIADPKKFPTRKVAEKTISGGKYRPENTVTSLAKSVARPLSIMKFGGTSVGNASSIEKVTEIVRSASREKSIIIVVSAMSGVTNKLVDAAIKAEAGDWEAVKSVFEELRRQHHASVTGLIPAADKRQKLHARMEELFQEGERLCQGTLLLRELTPRTGDSISSLGERLSAPLVAAVLEENGVLSASVDSSELVVTDSCHGGADPWMDLTRERCLTKLSPLIENSIVPVVTGFIGATSEGVLTTLGRGGSDYSATILGAAVEADEVIIWTDVDGLATADPRLVPGAVTIAEISYREAAELAYFGTKVLHPKTLRPVMLKGTTLWIRNTFEPAKPGTKITPEGPSSTRDVTALAVASDVAMISVGGPAIASVPDVLGRTFATTGAIRTDILLISHASSQNEICLVVPAGAAKHTVEALRREFASDLAYETVGHITLDDAVAMVTVVGRDLCGLSMTVGRTFGALGRKNIRTLAIAQGSSECSISLVVAKEDMKAALITAHAEFGLGEAVAAGFPVASADDPAKWFYQTESSRA